MINKNLEMSLNWPIIKSIISLSIPILFANLLQSAYQLTDAFWVGRLGWDAVASVSVSFPITFLVISLGSGFAIAWSTLIAQYAWAKNQIMVNHIAAQTLVMVAIVSLFFWSLWYLLAPIILSLMWISQWVYVDALSFLRVSFIWIIFVFAFAMFQSIMRWLWEVKMPMKIVMWTVLLNFLVDPLFIFGYWFVPALWVSWAAMATLITQWIATIIWLYVLLNWKYHIHLKLHDFKPDISYIKKAFRLWFPSSMEMSARSLWMLAITFLIASFWTQAVASYWAWWNVLQLVMIPAMWLSMSTSVLVGQNIWAKNIARASKIAKVSSLLWFLLLTFVWIIIFVLAEYFIKFFIPSDISIIDWWAHFLRIVSLTFWFIGLQLATSWVFRAAWNMKTTLAITLIWQWIIQLPVAYYLSKNTTLGIDWIWYSFVITNILTALISVLWFIKWDWKKKTLTSEERIKEKIIEEVIIEEWVR